MVSQDEPRSWLRDPELFGKPRRIMWKEVPKRPTDQVAYRAAQIQHALSARVTVVMPTRGYATLRELHGTASETARNSGPGGGLVMSYDRLGKILRGHAPMTLRHVADLERRLGPLLVGLKVDLAPWETRDG